VKNTPAATDFPTSKVAFAFHNAACERPIFSGTQLAQIANMASRAMINTLLNQLIEAQVVNVLRPGSGRRPQLLICDELMTICEQR